MLEASLKSEERQDIVGKGNYVVRSLLALAPLPRLPQTYDPRKVSSFVRGVKTHLDTTTVLLQEFCEVLQQLAIPEIIAVIKTAFLTTLRLVHSLCLGMSPPRRHDRESQTECGALAKQRKQNQPWFISVKEIVETDISYIPKEVIRARMESLQSISPSGAAFLLEDVSGLLCRNAKSINNFYVKERDKQLANEMEDMVLGDFYNSKDHMYNYIKGNLENCIKQGSGKYLLKSLNKTISQHRLEDVQSIGTQTKNLRNQEQELKENEAISKLALELAGLKEKLRDEVALNGQHFEQVSALKQQNFELMVQKEELQSKLNHMQQAFEVQSHKTKTQFSNATRKLKNQWREQLAELRDKHSRELAKQSRDSELKHTTLLLKYNKLLALLRREVDHKQVQAVVDLIQVEAQTQPLPCATPLNQIFQFKGFSQSTQNSSDFRSKRVTIKERTQKTECGVDEQNQVEWFAIACLLMKELQSSQHKSESAVALLEGLRERLMTQTSGENQEISPQKWDRPATEEKRKRTVRRELQPYSEEKELDVIQQLSQPFRKFLKTAVSKYSLCRTNRTYTRETKRASPRANVIYIDKPCILSRSGSSAGSTIRKPRINTGLFFKLQPKHIVDVGLLFVTRKEAQQYEMLPKGKHMFQTRSDFRMLKVDSSHGQAQQELEQDTAEVDRLPSLVHRFLILMSKSKGVAYRLLVNFLVNPCKTALLCERKKDFEELQPLRLSLRGVKILLQRIQQIHTVLCGKCRHVASYWQRCGITEGAPL